MAANCDFFFKKRLALPIAQDVLEADSEVFAGREDRKGRAAANQESMLAPAGPQVRTGAKVHAKSDKGERMERLVGRHVVVTGGGKGIGKAIAERLAAEGATLTLLARDLERLRAGGRRDRRERSRVRRPRPRAGRRGVRGRGGRTRPDPRPRREQRARRAERRRPRRPLRRPRRDESRRHVLLVARRSPPPRPGARHPPPRRDRIDPRPDRGARLHGLLRVEGRPARARPLLRRRAGRREHPGERDLPRLGRHRHGVGWAGGDRRPRPAGRARTPTATRCARSRSAGCPSRRTLPERSPGSCPTTPEA